MWYQYLEPSNALSINYQTPKRNGSESSDSVLKHTDNPFSSFTIYPYLAPTPSAQQPKSPYSILWGYIPLQSNSVILLPVALLGIKLTDTKPVICYVVRSKNTIRVAVDQVSSFSNSVCKSHKTMSNQSANQKLACMHMCRHSHMQMICPATMNVFVVMEIMLQRSL